jgi:predicted secreted protein
MKRLFKLVFIFVFIFFLCSCGKKGLKKDIVLLGNDDNYYNWIYSIEDKSIVSIVDEKYYGEESNDEVNGLGGEYIFALQGLREGKTTIKFRFAKSWEEEEELYNYYVDVLVDSDLNVEIVNEKGNYLYLMKFINIDKSILGLDKNFDEYMFYFSDDPVDYGEFECMPLSVYDYEGNAVGYYAISGSNNYVFKRQDGEYILLNKE